MRNLANIAKEISLLGNYEEYSPEILIDVLKMADHHYFNEEDSFMTDAEYDTLRLYVQKSIPHHSYFTGVGSEVRGGKVKLPYQMGSLDQIYEGEIEEWVRKWDLCDQFVIATDKLDGISAMIIYDEKGDLQIAYSRGDGTKGQILTSHINNINSIPKKVKNNIKCVRGELIISKKNWEIMRGLAKTTANTPYRNPRNCIAGLMNTITPHPQRVYDLIDFIAYEIKDRHEKDN